MTTIRGTVRGGQLVFPPEVTRQLGLREGEALELPEAVLAAARATGEEGGNPFVAWIGSLPPLPGGQDAVSFTRKLRDDESVDDGPTG